MERPRTDYDRLAADYDVRYSVAPLSGIGEALIGLARRSGARSVLEVGCGTGHWVRELAPHVERVYGADASVGMLEQAMASPGAGPLVAARANSLPFAQASFDLIFSVNAIHHFDDPCGFVRDAAGLLTARGVLAIVGIDPRLIRRRYFYEYFEGTYDLDIARYPGVGALVDAMAGAGFAPIEYRIVERYDAAYAGRAVFSDPFLKKGSNSLLALLSGADYDRGLRRMEAAIASAEAENRETEFVSELAFFLLAAWRQRQDG
jgi:ubiquinone/menaquinone biosynthesis C-methylase UbiE